MLEESREKKVLSHQLQTQYVDWGPLADSLVCLGEDVLSDTTDSSLVCSRLSARSSPTFCILLPRLREAVLEALVVALFSSRETLFRVQALSRPPLLEERHERLGEVGGCRRISWVTIPNINFVKIISYR